MTQVVLFFIYGYHMNNMRATMNIRTSVQESNGTLGKGNTGTVLRKRSLSSFFRQTQAKLIWPEKGDVTTFSHKAAIKIVRVSKATRDAAQMHIDIAAAQEKAGLHIVPKVYALAENTKDHEYYLGMEIIEGKTLSQVVEDTGRELSSEIMAKLKMIYRQLWHLGFVHGDPHKRNVMLMDNGELMIIDLDLALEMKGETISVLGKHADLANNVFFRTKAVRKAINASAPGRRQNYSFVENPGGPIQARTAPRFIRLSKPSAKANLV